MSKNTLEAVMGTFVLALTSFLLLFAYNHTSFKDSDGFMLTANFQSADGITIGTDVRMNGIKVGIVKEMELDKKAYVAKITLSIHEGIPVPKDSTAEVASEGLLGGKYISLIPGSDDEMLKNKGEIENTQSAVSLENLIGKMIFNSEKKDDKKDEPKDKADPHGHAH